MTKEEYRAIRKALNMTQAQLGTELGVAWITVCKRETGRHPITEESARAIQTLCDHKKMTQWGLSAELQMQFRICSVCGMSEVKA